jgi:hypothetical protein
MGRLKLEKDILRTATGSDLEYVGIQALDTPTPDYVAGANPSTRICSLVSEIVISQISEYTIEVSRRMTNSERPDSKKPSDECRPSLYTSAVP